MILQEHDMTLSTSRQRGTAMTETILALPFLLLILLFIAYFGRSSVRVERTHMLAKDLAVRIASQGRGVPTDPFFATGTRGEMNETWFNGTADRLTGNFHSNFPDDAYQRWQDGAARRSDDAGSLLDQMWIDFQYHAQAVTAHITSRHNSSNKFLELFNGDVHASHTVQNGDWKFINGYKHRADSYDPNGSQVHNLNTLRDIFYDGFDSTLEGMSDAQNPLASTIRTLYLNSNGYRGPEVP